MLNEHPLTGFIGAGIDGVDLRQPISEDLAQRLRDALARHQSRALPERNLAAAQ